MECFIYADASFLDEWSFDRFQNLLYKSKDDQNLEHLLKQDKIVIFLHLLGCDSNGHAHRPFSSIYLNNVKVVDRIAQRVYDLVEGHFKDNRTAYIFTADHGMSDKGQNIYNFGLFKRAFCMFTFFHIPFLFSLRAVSSYE